MYIHQEFSLSLPDYLSILQSIWTQHGILFIVHKYSEEDYKMEYHGKELSIPSKISMLYNESLSYNLYIIELPFLCENSEFEVAVAKINGLNNHPTFISTNTKIRLIGLLEFEEDEDGEVID